MRPKLAHRVLAWGSSRPTDDHNRKVGPGQRIAPWFTVRAAGAPNVTPKSAGQSGGNLYRTSAGKQWYRVQPRDKTKEPLFDRVKLAALLSEEVRKPLDPLQVPLTRGALSDDGLKFKFVAEDYQFEYTLGTEKLAKLLRPFSAEGMLAYRISALVNNSKNDVSQCVEAIR